MLTLLVLFYNFLPILKKCLFLAASLAYHLNLTFTCECKRLWSLGQPLFWCHPQEHCPPPRRQGLSLAQSPPIKLDWLSREPFSFPVSKTFPLLGLQVQTLLGLELRSSCFYQMIYFLKPSIWLNHTICPVS